MVRFQTLVAVALCLACAGAQAQWQWLDKDGRRVFSDRAPPPEVPAKDVMQQPGGMSRSAGASAAAASASDPSSASGAAQGAPEASAPKLGTVDKDLVEKKKQAELAAKAKAKAEDERVAKAKQENCERARAGKALMESGVRVSMTNANGQREVLEDAGRAEQQKRIQQSVDANCR